MIYKVESNVAYPRREAHAQPPARDCWTGQIDSHKAIIGASQKLQRLSAGNLAVREPAGRPAATGTRLGCLLAEGLDDARPRRNSQAAETHDAATPRCNMKRE